MKTKYVGIVSLVIFFFLSMSCSADFNLHSGLGSRIQEEPGDENQKEGMSSDELMAQRRQKEQELRTQISTTPIETVVQIMKAGKFANVCMYYDKTRGPSHNCNNTEYNVSINGVKQDRTLNLNNNTPRDVVIDNETYHIEHHTSVPATVYESNWQGTEFAITTECVSGSCNHRNQKLISYSLIGAVEITQGDITVTMYLKTDKIDIQEGITHTFDWKDENNLDKLQIVDYVPSFDHFCGIEAPQTPVEP